MGFILVLVGLIGLAYVFPPIIFIYLIGLGAIIAESRD